MAQMFDGPFDYDIMKKFANRCEVTPFANGQMRDCQIDFNHTHQMQNSAIDICIYDVIVSLWTCAMSAILWSVNWQTIHEVCIFMTDVWNPAYNMGYNK